MTLTRSDLDAISMLLDKKLSELFGPPIDGPDKQALPHLLPWNEIEFQSVKARAHAMGKYNELKEWMGSHRPPWEA